MKRTLLPCILILSLFTACYDDLDDVITPAGALEIKDFIWKGMNNIYLYKAEVPELADDRFADQEELNEFLDDFSAPENLFYDALLAPQDEFSFLVEDYIELENYFAGVSKSNGMEYGLARLSESSNRVIGYVRYVLPNTSAEEQGITRGNIFTSVDGQELTLGNYGGLLAPDSYTIGLAEIGAGKINPTEETVLLYKEEYTSNPVYIAKTIETSSGKVGYLMYNSFTGTFDAALNDAFAQFEAEGITDLVLDLRYNGGGSVASAVDLASMITGQFEGEVFATERWNQEYQDYFEANNPEELVNRFNGKIRTGGKINSLGLGRIFVITTESTASASELVINGLEPYIDVIQIGTDTRGKFQASVTLYDSEDFGRQGANLGHTYAIQPLVYKSVNSAGKTDYLNGLAPEIYLQEDLTELGTLGAPMEPLLAAALDRIQGKFPASKKSGQAFELVGESGMYRATFQRMYSEEVPPLPQLP